MGEDDEAVADERLREPIEPVRSVETESAGKSLLREVSLEPDTADAGGDTVVRESRAGVSEWMRTPSMSVM